MDVLRAALTWVETGRVYSFREADLFGANLPGVNLGVDEYGRRRADFSNSYLATANLEGANLRGARFTAADLVATNLRNADLAYADLQYADLTGANLQEATLTAANLDNANLTATKLAGATLQGAHLRNTDLRRTSGLTQEQIENTEGNRRTILPANLQVPETWYTEDDE
jgi:uncharacterized protein YjbI with pentapeptide repeats